MREISEFWVPGGNEMRSPVKISSVVAIFLCTTGGAWASSPPRPNMPPVNPWKPFATVSVPQTPLCFGEVPGPGGKALKATVTAHVLANHPYRLAASFQMVTQAAGQSAMPAKQLMVKINGKEVPTGTGRVEIASGGPTPATGVDVPVVIEIAMKDSALCPAGQYGGSLVLSIN